jgi:hypothetical protein
LTITGDLDLAFGYEQIRALVHLVLLELLPGWELDRDGAHLLVRAQNLRVMRLHVQAADVPSLHLPHFLLDSARSGGIVQAEAEVCAL